MPELLENHGLDRRAGGDRGRRDPARSSATTPPSRACAIWSATWPRCCARSRARSRAATTRAPETTFKVDEGRHRGLPRPAEVRARVRGAASGDRRDHRPGLDAVRRRDHVHRGHAHARQRPHHRHRPARRRDARVGVGGVFVRALARRTTSRSTTRSSASTTSTSTSRPAPSRKTAPPPAWPSPPASPR